MKWVNGGLSFGRTWVGFSRWRHYSPRRITWRTGGQHTPGPWWELIIPYVGHFKINRDRSLFGWDDPASTAPTDPPSPTARTKAE